MTDDVNKTESCIMSITTTEPNAASHLRVKYENERFTVGIPTHPGMVIGRTSIVGDVSNRSASILGVHDYNMLARKSLSNGCGLLFDQVVLFVCFVA
jgi:hypothetical protein